MPGFQFATKEVSAPDGPQALLVKLAGSIDPTSIQSFRELVNRLESGDQTNVIMDLESVKYINSTGVELMVHEADALRKRGGGTVLAHVPPKVTLLLETLGLNDFFRIADDQKEAFALLAGKQAAPANVQARLRTSEQPAAGAEAPQAKAAPSARGIACGHCGVRLTVAGPGAYRCPRCRALLQVDAGFNVQARPEAADGTVEVILPAQIEYIEALRLLLSVSAMRAKLGGDDLSGVSEAVEGCARILIHEALGDRATERMHVLVESSADGMSVCLYAAGELVDLAPEALAARDELSGPISQVDRVALEHPGEGNLFIVEKRAS